MTVVDGLDASCYEQCCRHRVHSYAPEAQIPKQWVTDPQILCNRSTVDDTNPALPTIRNIP